ncbi:Scr1 family TA system antitoxin-like transcriptional regulator [Micromonospora sp. NPDC001898]|uniref:Scr1 family TA system antitoxin-like transcriptional regulator n=1 Tax=Micromonospora sp. NPDC001898 TaxID=3364221 RepID=UPI003691F708
MSEIAHRNQGFLLSVHEPDTVPQPRAARGPAADGHDPGRLRSGHPLLGGAFVLASLPDGDPVGYLDDQLAGRVVLDPEHVVALERAWEAVRAEPCRAPSRAT